MSSSKQEGPFYNQRKQFHRFAEQDDTDGMRSVIAHIFAEATQDAQCHQEAASILVFWNKKFQDADALITSVYQERESEQMRKAGAALIATMFLAASPAAADIEKARDLMEENRFAEALAELEPAARSGNADAEELIGVMYAMGRGVERDDVRAFEWYLRSAMKGHPGAQSGVGWYYETGRGMPAPDLVRAYMWYVLSTIGGDPDAAISQEEVIKKMTRDEIEKAHVLIDDYRKWLYPFR